MSRTTHSLLAGALTVLALALITIGWQGLGLFAGICAAGLVLSLWLRRPRDQDRREDKAEDTYDGYASTWALVPFSEPHHPHDTLQVHHLADGGVQDGSVAAIVGRSGDHGDDSSGHDHGGGDGGGGDSGGDDGVGGDSGGDDGGGGGD